MKIQRKEIVFALQKGSVQCSGFQNIICVLNTIFKCNLNGSSISKPLLRRDALTDVANKIRAQIPIDLPYRKQPVTPVTTK